jgi:hypothetical protein
LVLAAFPAVGYGYDLFPGISMIKGEGEPCGFRRKEILSPQMKGKVFV